jgi:ribose/xylose/arabinose/galactoside ABC-type transport system permease subunit
MNAVTMSAERLLRPTIVQRLRNASTLVMVVVAWIAMSFASPYFLTTENISNVFERSATLALLAMGLTVVLIAAEIDLSVGSIEALGASVVAVLMVNTGVPVPIAIVMTILLGAVVGSITGLVTVTFGVPSFISSLAMLSIASGFALVVTDGRPISGLPSDFNFIGTGDILGIPVAVWIAAAVGLVLAVVMKRTRFGLHVYALGDSAWAARSAGLRPARIRVGVLALSGGLASLAGLIVAAELNSGNATIGTDDLLSAIAAVVIGGTSLFGGVGTISGSLLGVLLIGTLRNGLDLLNVQAFWQQVVIGLMILAAVIFDYLLRPKEEKSDR